MGLHTNCVLIAHRGLLDGPSLEMENNPEVILEAIKHGFDCEVDLWVVGQDLFLGHDAPRYPIERDFIIKEGLWVHAKNLDAMKFLRTTNVNYFWHQNDDRVLTSHGFIWTYPGRELCDHSIRVMPEWETKDFSRLMDGKCYGICSDYVMRIRSGK